MNMYEEREATSPFNKVIHLFSNNLTNNFACIKLSIRESSKSGHIRQVTLHLSFVTSIFK